MRASVSTVTKADFDRFLACKHAAGCPVCGRSSRDVSMDTINCQCASSTDASIDVVMSACKSCGSVQIYSLAIVARWLEQQRGLWARNREATVRAGAPESLMAAQIDYHNQQRVAAAAVVFLLVAMAALLLHRHGGAELWSRPTIATVETGARA